MDLSRSEGPAAAWSARISSKKAKLPDISILISPLNASEKSKSAQAHTESGKRFALSGSVCGGFAERCPVPVLKRLRTFQGSLHRIDKHPLIVQLYGARL